MERRKFIAAMSALMIGAKSSAAKTLKTSSKERAEESGGQMIEKLKSLLLMGKTYDLNLPENPTPIETVVTVKVELARGKKLPKIIATNNSMINGNNKPVVLREEGEYNIQFVGEECGWMVL